MSDTSQGEGWWIASDGKWYAPELHPDYVAPATPPSSAAPVPPTTLPAAEATVDPLSAPTYPSSPPVAAATREAPATLLPDSLIPPDEPSSSRRGLLLGVGALVLLAGLGFVLFRLLSGGGAGADSPDEAVQQMIDSIRDLDAVGLAEILDPDEIDGWVGSFVPASETFNAIATDGPPTDQFDEFAEKLSEAISIAITGPGGDEITYDVRELDPRGRISRVRIQGLAVEINVNETFDEALIVGPPGDLIALDLEAIDGASLDVRDQLGGLDVRAFVPEVGSEGGFVDNAHLDLVAVEKDGGWFVSIGYSILENIQNEPSTNLGRPDYGRAYALVDSGDGGADSPEDVVRQMATAMESLDYGAAIRLTDPMSMPYLHDFQPAIDDNVDTRDLVDASRELGLDISTLELATTPWNDRTLVTVEQIAGGVADGTFELDTSTWCAEATSPDGEDVSGCLEDGVEEFLREIDETGVDPRDVVPESVGFVVIEREGRWFFDPLGTVGYYLDQIAETAADLDFDEALSSATPVDGFDAFLALSAPVAGQGTPQTATSQSGQAGVALDLTGFEQDLDEFEQVQVALARIESDGSGVMLGVDDRPVAAEDWAVAYSVDNDDPTFAAIVVETEGPITVTLEEPEVVVVTSEGISGAIDADGRPQILTFEPGQDWTFEGQAFYETIYAWDAPGVVTSGSFWAQQFGDPSFGSFAVVTGEPGDSYEIFVETFSPPPPPPDDEPPPIDDPPPADYGDPRIDRFLDVAFEGEFTEFSFDQSGGYFDGCGPDDPDVTTVAYADSFGDLALVTPYPSEARAIAAFEALTTMTAPCDSFPDLEFVSIEVTPGEDTVTIAFSFGGEEPSWERYGRRGDVIIATTSTSLEWIETNWSRLESYQG